MKIWIKTKMVGTGTEEEPRRPYTADQSVMYSSMDLGDEALSRISGTPEQIELIKTDPEITVLTDDEAKTIIKSRYPDSDLENLDVADVEIDEIAKSLGLDPKLRADIVIPTRGKQVLQDQENYLMSHICEKIGLTRGYWDREVKESGKWQYGKQIEDDIKNGRIDAHEFVLSRIREKLKKLK